MEGFCWLTFRCRSPGDAVERNVRGEDAYQASISEVKKYTRNQSTNESPNARQTKRVCRDRRQDRRLGIIIRQLEGCHHESCWAWLLLDRDCWRHHDRRPCCIHLVRCCSGKARCFRGRPACHLVGGFRRRHWHGDDALRRRSAPPRSHGDWQQRRRCRLLHQHTR